MLLFTAGGYRILLAVQEQKAGRSLEAMIDDKQYKESDLVVIKVALNMPYQTRQTPVERHYGEIRINGMAYRYVERMVNGDTLVLKCLPDETKQALSKTADALATSNSNQQQDNNGKNQNFSLLKLLSGDYDDRTASTNITATVNLSSDTYNQYDVSLSTGTTGTPFQPPRLS